MNAQQPQTRDLDLWFVNKDTDGAVKPGPGIVYDRAGPGWASSSSTSAAATSRSPTQATPSRRGPVSAHACPPRWHVTSPPRSSGSRTSPRV